MKPKPSSKGTVEGANTCKAPPEGCSDCLDLHNKHIQHGCHCHVKEQQLPNLGDLIDKQIIKILYLRADGDSRLMGVRLTFNDGSVLVIDHTRNKLDITLGRLI